jgi:hypothetical protein
LQHLFWGSQNWKKDVCNKFKQSLQHLLGKRVSTKKTTLRDKNGIPFDLDSLAGNDIAVPAIDPVPHLGEAMLTPLSIEGRK